jgi:hypothetical protein
MSDWTLRGDLELFGIKLPERFSVDDWAAKLREDPARNTLALVGLATLLFYKAEKEHNPKVNDIWDSLVYVTTNLSVGFSDIFARTTMGKIVGSALMTFGPSMAANIINGSGGAQEGGKGVQGEILETLQKILRKLESGETSAAPGGNE